MSDVFGPAGPGGNWHLNAVVEHHSDHEIAMGFAETADLIVEHWIHHGPYDLLFEPLVFNLRHALELVLKAAIRETAARLRADGRRDTEVNKVILDDWLAREASHNLHKLAERLNELLGRLELDALPSETHSVLISLHELDPGGDAFRYAKIRGPNGAWRVAPRPLLSKPDDLQAHVDVVAMHEHFRSAFNLLSGGVMTVLAEIADVQADMDCEAGW